MTITQPVELLKPSTRRMRALLYRRKNQIQLPHCDVCGAKCTAKQSIALKMCSGCRRLTSEGRAKARQQFKEIFQRSKYLKRYLDGLGVTLTPSQWDWHQADQLLPTEGVEVVAETLRGAFLVAKYYSDLGWVDVIDEGTDGLTVQVKKWCLVTKLDPF